MDFRKLLTIALKDVRVLFSDRNLLLTMIAAPLALTFIIGAAFSKFTVGGGGGDVPIENIGVAVVNEDQGATVFLQKLNYGDIITNILVPADPANPPNDTLHKLIKAQKLTRDEAINQVKAGKLTAAILIPADFSASLDPNKDKPAQTQITVYRDTASPISASIVSSVVRGIVNNLTSGSIAIFAAKDQVSAGKANPALLIQSQKIAQTVNDQLQKSPPITLSERSVTGQKPVGSSFDPLQYFAPAMAIFFLTFTMAGSAGGIIEEGDHGTLQRMLSSPTTQATILGGKLGGTYISGVLQITILLIATALLAPLMGSPNSVWGTNILGVALVTLCAVAAATGLGTLIAGLARTAQQADTISSAVLILSGVVGGAFFNLAALGPAFQSVSKITLNYWATNAYSTLAQTGDLGAVLPNLIILLGMFVVYFGIGLMFFNRRLKL